MSDVDLLDSLPGWEAFDVLNDGDDWPDDIGKDNPAWVEPEFDAEAWEAHDRWTEAERDAHWEAMRAEPWRFSLIACGTCHPELLRAAP